MKNEVEEEVTETIEAVDTQHANNTPNKKISKTWAWAIAHPGIIYEVTDPELRSQLANYRNKQHQEDVYEAVNA